MPERIVEIKADDTTIGVWRSPQYDAWELWLNWLGNNYAAIRMSREEMIELRDNINEMLGENDDNEPTCTCGAQFIEGCFCNVTPKQFYSKKVQ